MTTYKIIELAFQSFRVICLYKQKYLEGMAESIYNIIPQQEFFTPKAPIYKSKYPYDIPPTGSTFGQHTTSKPIGTNLNGQFSLGLQAHSEHGQTKTFGHVKGDRKPNPQSFLKKHTGTMGNETLPTVRNFSYDHTHKKDPIPAVHDRPVHGLKSNKNFLVSNAIQNILSTAKRAPEETDWLKKKEYGKTPQYLQKIKESVSNEYKMIQTLHEENQKQTHALSEEEVMELKEGLKRKWNEINHQYQRIAHIRVIDTFGLRSKKLGYEKQLAQIEKDIKKLNKAYVFVDE